MKRTAVGLISTLSLLVPALSVAQGQALHGGGDVKSRDAGYAAMQGQGSSKEGISSGLAGTAVSPARGLNKQGAIMRYDDLLVVAADRDYVINGSTVLVDAKGRLVPRQELYQGRAVTLVRVADGDAPRPVALEVIVYDKMSDVE